MLAAVLAVSIPSLAYTGTVMTENAFYPLFLVLSFVLVLMLERPTALRVALLVALVALAFATRVQALAIVPAVLLAPLLLAVFERTGLRPTLSRFRLLYGAFAALGVLALVVRLGAGLSLDDLLGAYSPVSDASYDADEVLRYLFWHVAELGLYLLVIPVAATIVLVGRARTLDRPLQELLSATVALTVCLVPVVAAFASVFSDRIEERNLFYIAPLFLILLLAWLERGAPRPRVLAPVAAAVSALLVLAPPAHGQKKAIVVALNQDPDILDPTLARTYVGRIVFAQICEKLYEIDEQLQIHPQLAAGLPQVTDGGRTGAYRHGVPATEKNLKNKISRADVADFMLKQVAEETYLGKAPTISY